MKKVLLPGLLAGLVMLIIGMALGQGLNMLIPSLMAEYNNTNIFRPWSDPLGYIYFVHPFLVGIILAWIWNRAKSLFGGGSAWKRGTHLGLVFWIITTIPGMVISYASFKLSLVMILSWTVLGLIQFILAGIICAAMNK
jgi:hypothetical protein